MEFVHQSKKCKIYPSTLCHSNKQTKTRKPLLAQFTKKEGDNYLFISSLQKKNQCYIISEIIYCCLPLQSFLPLTFVLSDISYKDFSNLPFRWFLSKMPWRRGETKANKRAVGTVQPLGKIEPDLDKFLCFCPTFMSLFMLLFAKMHDFYSFVSFLSIYLFSSKIFVAYMLFSKFTDFTHL